MKNVLTKENGITLIALVLTTVVTVLIATVAIRTAMEMSISEQAINGIEKYKASEYEQGVAIETGTVKYLLADFRQKNANLNEMSTEEKANALAEHFVNQGYTSSAENGVLKIKKGNFQAEIDPNSLTLISENEKPKDEPTAEDTLKISNIEELIDFRNKVNSGNTFENKKIQLIDNIDLSTTSYKVDGTAGKDKSWIPIGNATNMFMGEFDGKGNEITGLYINTAAGYQGLFGYVKDATIKDLKIQGEINSSSINYNGLLCGCIDGNTNISDILIKSNSVVKGQYACGGAIGLTTESALGTITKVINNASVTGNRFVGGIIGIVQSSNVTISKCGNNREIKGSKNVGGVARSF